LRLSFRQIGRVFEAYTLNDEAWLKKFRLIAYETWRKGGKNVPSIESYMPIGREKGREMTEAELDEIWLKYGKLNKKKLN